ncbi:MAG: hypothetical protein WCA20_25545 [Candidatus Sulfotelmatobacter sp.]
MESGTAAGCETFLVTRTIFIRTGAGFLRDHSCNQDGDNVYLLAETPFTIQHECIVCRVALWEVVPKHLEPVELSRRDLGGGVLDKLSVCRQSCNHLLLKAQEKFVQIDSLDGGFWHFVRC